MCNKELLVSYLYDDLDDRDRATLESHLQVCDACREELTALRDIRVDLSAWTPALPELGFRIVRKSQAPPRTWRAWWTPAAGLASAAVLVLAAAASIAHVEVHRGPDGVTVRTGWSTAPTITQPAARDVRLAAAPDVDAAALKEIERRINALETAVRSAPQTRNASVLSARSSDEEILKVVRDLLAQSETRQKGELAVRMAQVIRDMDLKRNADLNNVRVGMAKIDASVTAEAAAHHELTNYILTSAKQK